MDEFNKDPGNREKEKAYLRNIKKGFKKLVDKDGFYIILFICICIVGTTAVWVSTNNAVKLRNAKDNEGQELNLAQGSLSDHEVIEKLSNLYKLAQAKENDTEEKGTKDESSVKVVKIEDTSKSNGTEEKNNNQEKEVQKTNTTPVSNQSKSISMAMPLKGTISMEYARDKLVFSKTLEQWTTHNGVDISAREGSVIRAALDGVVTSIKKDYELGIIISIDHGNGLVTRYAGVSTDEMVEVGQRVSKGDPISGVGKGTGFEIAQGPHLHFEVLKDGKYVNPEEYLPLLD